MTNNTTKLAVHILAAVDQVTHIEIDDFDWLPPLVRQELDDGAALHMHSDINQPSALQFEAHALSDGLVSLTRMDEAGQTCCTWLTHPNLERPLLGLSGYTPCDLARFALALEAENY